jgi:diguanylate cyclase (GGDEF)-like protein
LKRWIHKLINQFNFEWEENPASPDGPSPISEDRATLLYIIDTFNKHLLEVERHPVRKIREVLDDFARELILPDRPDQDKLLFRFRMFFASYRIDEYAYIQKTFDEFRSIIWDFVDQLSEDLSQEQLADNEISSSLENLREAVESNSIDMLKTQSRKFIDSYVEHQVRKDKRKSQRMHSIKKNLDSVRKQLLEANQTMRMDHLTGAYNRKSFDEQLKQYVKMQNVSPAPVTLLTLDIDHFKKVNDTFGHAVGDFALKECVKTLNKIFSRGNDFVARIGGEEFAVLLPDYGIDKAVQFAEQVLNQTRKDVFVHEGHELRFTVSMGIAQFQKGETPDQWLKRADEALYKSKQTGRNRYTVSVSQSETPKAA